jgi:quinoprotein glucose dehydrogenase
MHKNGTIRDSSPILLPFKMGVPSLGGPITIAGGHGSLGTKRGASIIAYALPPN